MSSAEKPADAVYRRHLRIWKVLQVIIGRWLRNRFNFSFEEFDLKGIDGPVIVIPNHSCAWDPIMMGVAFRDRQIYFVASEHILRWRFFGPVINWLVEPIPRKKANMGSGTVKACLRHLKAGHSVCIFAEGEQSWDGRTGRVRTATGKLVKRSGATLITYRLEGAYLAMPRWAKGIRRGKVYGHPVNIYGPEELAAMTPEQIAETINSDIYYDIWKWQESQPGGPVAYSGGGKAKEPARGMERALFMCPGCRRTGTLGSSGDVVSCGCGYKVRYLKTGFLEPAGAAPETGSRYFRTIAEWDDWQTAELLRCEEGFSDPFASLYEVSEGHTDTLLTEGSMTLVFTNGAGEQSTNGAGEQPETDGGQPDAVLTVGDRSFALPDITMMAPVLSNIIMFSANGGYYQITAENTNVRKYVLMWKHVSGEE